MKKTVYEVDAMPRSISPGPAYDLSQLQVQQILYRPLLSSNSNSILKNKFHKTATQWIYETQNQSAEQVNGWLNVLIKTCGQGSPVCGFIKSSHVISPTRILIEFDISILNPDDILSSTMFNLSLPCADHPGKFCSCNPTTGYRFSRNASKNEIIFESDYHAISLFRTEDGQSGADDLRSGKIHVTASTGDTFLYVDKGTARRFPIFRKPFNAFFELRLVNQDLIRSSQQIRQLLDPTNFLDVIYKSFQPKKFGNCDRICVQDLQTPKIQDFSIGYADFWPNKEIASSIALQLSRKLDVEVKAIELDYTKYLRTDSNRLDALLIISVPSWKREESLLVEDSLKDDETLRFLSESLLSDANRISTHASKLEEFLCSKGRILLGNFIGNWHQIENTPSSVNDFGLHVLHL